MNIEDMGKPAGIVFGAAALIAAGFAAGFIVARDPSVVRRLARAVAGGAERFSLALAETREELADLWAEARDDARAAAEASAFAADERAAAGAAGAGASAATTPAEAAQADAEAPGGKPSRVPAAAPRRRSRAPSGGK